MTVKGGVMRRRSPRARGEGGAAAVEFALLFPIFMILALGIIAGGTAFSRQINVTQAAREASRFGATLDISSQTGATKVARVDTWLAAVDDAAKRAAGNGNNSAAAATNYIGGYDYRCVALVVTDSTGAVTSDSRYKLNGAAPVGGAACPATTAAAIPSTTFVQVVLSRDVKFFVLFINPTIQVDAVSTTPYERTFS